MGKYLKMADVFNACDVVETDVKVLYAISEEFDDGVTPHEYAHHAIQYHDELVAEVERLRGVASELSGRLQVEMKQFSAIRSYTEDGKLACICADHESKIDELLKKHKI